MGQSAAQTVREIERTRARLGDELDELEDRLPALARWAKRAAGIAAGGGVAGSLFLLTVKRVRKRRRSEPEVSVDGSVPAQITVNVLPERWAEKLEGDGARPWIIAGVVGWLGLRLIQMRQMRRLRAAIASGSR